MEQAETRRAHYKNAIDKLLADMQTSYDSGSIDAYRDNYQLRLDKLASVYQNDESLGRLRYKLYEAQAYLHFLRENYRQAEQFIGKAIDMYGGRFKSATELQELIARANTQQGASVHTSDVAQRFAKSGLAMFIVGLPLLLIGNNLGGFVGSLLGVIGDLSMLYGIIIGVRKAIKRTYQPIQWPIVGFALGVAIVLSIGYWLGYHPYRVHQYCEGFATKAASGGYPLNSFELNNTYPGIYDACVSQRGL
jgi:hypothetical protein